MPADAGEGDLLPDDERVLEIATRLAPLFRTFGGGDLQPRGWSNPIASALKSEPLTFAAGVDVLQVVAAVLLLDRAIELEDRLAETRSADRPR